MIAALIEYRATHTTTDLARERESLRALLAEAQHANTELQLTVKELARDRDFFEQQRDMWHRIAKENGERLVAKDEELRVAKETTLGLIADGVRLSVRLAVALHDRDAAILRLAEMQRKAPSVTP